MTTFNYLPDWSAEVTHDPVINKIQFGDGYQQREAVGINNDLASWSVKFERSPEEANTIYEFLKARGGVEAFNWVDPFGSSITVVTEGQYTRTVDDIGYHTVTATFKQVPERVSA